MSLAWYNENDPKAAAWLRELIKAGLIAPGVVDERSIIEIKSHELNEYTQCHFFAGIGGWSCALRLAGWADDKKVWTGSCPCQPFSQAGKGKVDSDERHLWPAFREAISECRPSVCFGEQVASKDGRIWLAGVRTDLEALGYAVGAADLCAAGVAAPHLRQRLYWVAHRDSAGRGELRRAFAVQPEHPPLEHPREEVGRVANAASARCHGSEQGAEGQTRDEARMQLSGAISGGCGKGFWNDFVLVAGRRVKPGLSLLAHGIPGRVAQLRGFGNAIVPQLAAEFIQAYLQTQTES